MSQWSLTFEVRKSPSVLGKVAKAAGRNGA